MRNYIDYLNFYEVFGSIMIDVLIVFLSLYEKLYIFVFFYLIKKGNLGKIFIVISRYINVDFN